VKILVRYPIADAAMHELLQKYPFLRKRFSDYRDDPTLCFNTEKEDIRNNWLKAWDGTGWEKLWKVYFMQKLFEAYNSWDDEKKQNFHIYDTKSKFGSLRISTSFDLPDDLEYILEWMSEFICEHCGKETIDEHGRQYIYHTRGWISNLCEDCLRGLYQSNVDFMEKDEVDKGIEGMKHYGDAFGYKRWIGNGFITKKYKYNKDHTWLVNYRTEFDKEQQK
jgi:hypothetical protein